MALHCLLWSFMVFYGLACPFNGNISVWTYMFFSRGHRSKFIWSCLSVIWTVKIHLHDIRKRTQMKSNVLSMRLFSLKKTQGIFQSHISLPFHFLNGVSSIIRRLEGPSACQSTRVVVASFTNLLKNVVGVEFSRDFSEPGLFNSTWSHKIGRKMNSRLST